VEVIAMTAPAAVKDTNRLPTLAAGINESHVLAMQHANKAIEHAFRCGDLLIEAKAKVPHGQWLPWLRQNVDFSERSVQVYMRIAQRLGRNPQRAADLSLRDALREIQSPRRDYLREAEAEMADLLKGHDADCAGRPPHSADWTLDDARACADRIRGIDGVLHRYGLCFKDTCTVCDAEDATLAQNGVAP